MPKTLLQPYAAFTLMDKRDPCPCLGINSSTLCHYLNRRFIYLFTYEPGDEERIVIEHARITLILSGRNLGGDALHNALGNIADFHVFDPARHAPVADPTAPIIRQWERTAARLKPMTGAPHLELV